MPRGGKRPGAGAPKGNLNALKHGRRSAQLAQLGLVLAGNPDTREAMLNFARRLGAKQEDAIQAAIEFHARILEHARKIALGEYSPGPFEHLLKGREAARGDAKPESERLNVQSLDGERRSIVPDRPSAASRKHGRRRQRQNHHPHNRAASTVSSNNQTPIQKQAENPLIDRKSRSVVRPDVADS